MKTFIKKITWLPGVTHGWGNGYVIIPEGHPLHGKDYDDIDVAVHGGLTFSESAKNIDWEEITEEDRNGWVVGFDTAHYSDSLSNWSKISVQKEVRRLAKQLENYKEK
jgi:hypothetical protein